MIDLYEALSIKLDADTEEINKAYKQASLRCHPDKVQGTSADKEEAAEKFNQIKLAKDVLSDPERRKIYDTFGFDLGEERPETEVWNIGVTSMASPLGGFIVKTIILRVALWFVSFVWIRWLLILAAIPAVACFVLDVEIKGVRCREPEILGLWINFGILWLIILFQWLWPLVADGASILYLIAELTGLDMLVQMPLVGGGLFLLSLVLAWFVTGRWWWVFGFELLLGLILLISLTVATGIMRLWVDSVHTRTGEKLKESRMALRAEKKRLQDEATRLRDKLRTAKLTADPDIVSAQKKKILEEQAYWEKKLKEEQSAK
eukprot:TRINITY_DN92932_c0_g1_i1.p1 TRINITY_DN92932_c0_g1~~TRINITY_DN92932_c0_g1_i1.p1  ORF type:complete len:319 (-),score=57.02 TRINITY_DN92932_c0_g1_i1:163-1119(-)